jgi:hypothetical protein
VIVVIGSPLARVVADGSVEAGGLAAQLAGAAASAGGSVQIVGRVGEDASGGAALLDLARRGVGHVAVLRDAARTLRIVPADSADDVAVEAQRELDVAIEGVAPTLDAADIGLALSYLSEYGVIVVAEALSTAAMRVVAEASGWSGARLIVLGTPNDDLADVPDDATVFAPPDDGDPDGSFATMVGTYAAGLDRGDEPKAAFAAASAAVGSSAAD